MPKSNSISLISIGIPFYNAQDYLDYAIKSVLAQTYNNWELILMDDGSSDNSLAIANSYARNDHRIRVISDGKNMKLPARLNQLISESNGEFIARMDADDIMHPERLATQLTILENNPDIDVLGTNAYTIDANNNITGVRQVISDEVVAVEGFIHPSVMAKTSWYKKNKYDEAATRSQDSLLWKLTAASSNFKATRQPLMFYREITEGYYKKYWIKSKAFAFMSIRANGKYSKKYLMKNSAKDFLKCSVYFVFSLVDFENVLVARRNKGYITNNDKVIAKKALDFFMIKPSL